MGCVCAASSPCLVEEFASVANEENLQRLLDGDLSLEVLVVHQKLHYVEESPRLETCQAQPQPVAAACLRVASREVKAPPSA